MTAKADAVAAFEALLEEAEQRGDESMARLAEGLLALTRMVTLMRRDIERIERKIK